MTRNGQVRYALKTPWRNGMTQVIFEPLDFMFRMGTDKLTLDNSELSDEKSNEPV